MKRLFLVLAAAGILFGQSNELQLGDQQTSRHFFTWQAPASITTNVRVQDFTPIAQGALINGSAVANLYSSTAMGVHLWYDPSAHVAWAVTFDAANNPAPWNFGAGGATSTGGFASATAAGTYLGFQSASDGSALPGYQLSQNAAGTAGGYFRGLPITYPPTSGQTCLDVYSNAVGQPSPLPGLPSNLWTTGTQSDVLWWNSSSPLQGYASPENGTVNVSGTAVTWVSGTKFLADVPGDILFIAGLPYPIYAVNSQTSITLTTSAGTQTGVPFGGGWVAGVYPINQPPCAAPLKVPAGAPFGWNTNSYVFTLEGFATASQAPNAFQTFAVDAQHAAGGAYFGAVAFGSEYPAGTTTRTGVLTTAKFLGGYGYFAAADQDPAAGTIATVDNPLVQGYTLQPGIVNYNSAIGGAGCLRVYNGSSFECIGGWTRNGTLLYANNATDQILIGRNTEDGSSSALEIVGKLASGNYNAIDAMGTIQSYLNSGSTDATTPMFSGKNAAGTQAFWVSGAGELALAGETPLTAWTQTANTLPSLASNQGGITYGTTASSCNYRVWSGSAWVTVNFCSSTGVSSLNALSGALSIAGTTNEITVTPSGSTITLATPQGICTACNPTFNTLATTSGIQINQSTGYGLYLPSSFVLAAGLSSSGLSSYGSITSTSGINAGTDANGGYWVGGSKVITTGGQFDGSGGVLTSGNVQGYTLNATYNIELNGTQVVNNSGQFVGAAVNTAGVVQSAGGVNVITTTNYNSIQTVGGFYASGSSSNGYAFSTGSYNVISNGGGIFPQGILQASGTSATLYIGSGSFYNRTWSGSDASCSGVTDGWMGVRTDTGQIELCAGGTLYKK
jgi:hypothetical protein